MLAAGTAASLSIIPYPQPQPIPAPPHPTPTPLSLPPLVSAQLLDGNPDAAAHVPLNDRVITLESDLFKGKLLLSVRGAPNAEAASRPGGPLACSRRTFHVALQGTFKRPLPADQLVSGQELPKAPRLSPS